MSYGMYNVVFSCTDFELYGLCMTAPFIPDRCLQLFDLCERGVVELGEEDRFDGLGHHQADHHDHQ